MFFGISRLEQLAIARNEGKREGYKKGFKDGYHEGAEDFKNLYVDIQCYNQEMLSQLFERITLKKVSVIGKERCGLGIDEFYEDVYRIIISAEPMAYQIKCNELLIEHLKEIIELDKAKAYNFDIIKMEREKRVNNDNI